MKKIMIKPIVEMKGQYFQYYFHWYEYVTLLWEINNISFDYWESLTGKRTTIPYIVITTRPHFDDEVEGMEKTHSDVKIYTGFENYDELRLQFTEVMKNEDITDESMRKLASDNMFMYNWSDNLVTIDIEYEFFKVMETGEYQEPKRKEHTPYRNWKKVLG